MTHLVKNQDLTLFFVLDFEYRPLGFGGVFVLQSDESANKSVERTGAPSFRFWHAHQY
jgi:hypothetical protein